MSKFTGITSNIMGKHHELITSILIATATYVAFFYVLLQPNVVFWGSDAENKFHPTRTYLYEQIVEEGRFPFWTERMFSGFPIYADIENAYLNPANIAFTVLFGPTTGYKLLHFVSYLIGSLGLYLFLKMKNIGHAGYAVANVIFYFSHFFINHQIHTSMVMTLYYFPLSLFLVDKYFSNFKFKSLFAGAVLFAYIFYWGHPQALIIYLIGLLSYILVYYFSWKDKNFLFKYLVLTTVLSGLLILPQLIPSLALNLSSTRSIADEEISANTGSLVPSLVSLVGYPSLFGKTNPFDGEGILEEYTVTETYIYAGITALILAVLGIAYSKDKKLGNYALLLISIFIVLGFARYIPLINLDNIPLISYFRYWNRTVILGMFGIALLAASFINELGNKSSLLLQKDSIKKGAYLLGLIGILNVIHLWNPISLGIIKAHLIRLYLKEDFLVWALIVGSNLLLSYLLLKANKLKSNFKIYQVLFIVLLFFDLWYFSKDLMNFRTQRINTEELRRYTLSEEFDNKRIVVTANNIEDSYGLYYKNWSPYGYSQFIPEKYEDFFEKNDDMYLRKSLETDIETVPEKSLRKLGIYAVYDPSNDETMSKTKYINKDLPLDIITTDDIEGSYIFKQEGHIKFNITTKEEQLLNTYIRGDAGWRLYINGESTELNYDDVFLAFRIPEGESIVELKYVPIYFYLGVFMSVVGLVITAIIKVKYYK